MACWKSESKTKTLVSSPERKVIAVLITNRASIQFLSNLHGGNKNFSTFPNHKRREYTICMSNTYGTVKVIEYLII